MRTLKRILGVLLIFVFGVFVGSVVTGAGLMNKVVESILGGPEAAMGIVVKRLDRELKLDPEQKRKLQVIVDDARIKLRQSRAKIQPEVEDALHEAEERTRAILYPDQVKKFDEILRKSRERWKAQSAKSPPIPATPTPDTATPAAPAPTTPVPATPPLHPAEDAK